MNIPRPYKIRQYFLPSEVAIHNTADDCWVVIFHNVYDLSMVVKENINSDVVDPIVLNAGKDISHWFDKDTLEPIKYVNPETNKTEEASFTG